MGTSSVDAATIKIGEMLIKVGALTSGDLTEAIQIAKRMGVPIGRVLVMSGCVTDDRLKQTLEIQSLIKDGLVDIDTAYQALGLIFAKNMKAQEALAALDWKPKQDQQSNKLGDLLVDSMIISRAELDRALEASFQSGMPLGGTLVLQGMLSPMLLPTVLHIQESVRENKVSRDQAVCDLKQALMYWARAENSKQGDLQAEKRPSSTAKKSGTHKARASDNKVSPVETSPAKTQAMPAAAAKTGSDRVSLIELLKLSGFCTQTSLDRAIQDAFQDDRLAAKLLLAISFIDPDKLNEYVHLQALVARGRMKTDQALFVLNSMRHRQLSLADALAEIGVSPDL